MPSASTAQDRALLELCPRLATSVSWLELATLPTPVEPLDALALAAGGARGDLWCKRDDLTSPLYGGNKIRALELLFGQCRRDGASEIAATGAFGSNHALATVLHAPRAGLRAVAALYPQPPSPGARANLRATLSHADRVQALWHWSQLPWWLWLRRGRHAASCAMAPGGASALGAFGCLSAALELAGQVAAGQLPRPAEVVVAAGSGCTTAGLLLGFHHAARLGRGFSRPPRLRAVRVVPWPVTSQLRIVELAVHSSRLLAELGDDPSLAVSAAQLRDALVIDGGQLGGGYGHPTAAGNQALESFRRHAGIELDGTYSGKAAASLLGDLRASPKPILFWSTRSTAPLPEQRPERIAAAPPRMRAWLDREG